MTSLRIPECSDVLVDEDFGRYVRVLLLGDLMKIKGVFVNGRILNPENIASECGWTDECINPNIFIEEMVRKNLLVSAEGVLMVPDAPAIYIGTSYDDEDLSAVVSKLRENLKGGQLKNVVDSIHGLGKFTKTQSKDEQIQKLKYWYGCFGDHKPIVFGYMRSFLTPAQLKNGNKMSLSRHLRLVKELLEMYETGVVRYKDVDHRVERDAFVMAIDSVAKRGIQGFKNHNYLKVTAIAFAQENKTKEPSSERTSVEGYR